MTATGSPRDFAGWMKEVDRGLRSAKRAGAQANARIDEIVLPVGPGNPAPSAPGPIPAAPVEITFQTSVYFDEFQQMRWRGRIYVDFPAVTRSTEAQPITVRSYELQGYAVSSLAQPNDPPLWVTFGFSDEPSIISDDLIPGETYIMRVRADNGLWSETFRATVVKDTIPPPQPTAPEALALPGVIRVMWDKLAVNGAMPPDFAYISVAAGLDPSPTEEVAQIDAVQPMYMHAGVEYYTPVFFRFQAVDHAGNRSDWSEQATAYLKPLVNEDVIITRLDAAETEIVNAELMLFNANQTLGDKLDFHRNKITANQLLIGRGENFIPWFVNHPTPELRTLAPHTIPAEATGFFEGNGGRSGGPGWFVRHEGIVAGTQTEVLRFRSGGETRGGQFQVEPNTTYKMSVWVRAGGTYTGAMPKVQFEARAYMGDGTYEAGSSAYGPAKLLSFTWQEVVLEYTTSAAADTLLLRLFSDQPGVVRVDGPMMVKDGSSLIATGGITTNMLYVTEEMVAKLLSVRKVRAGDIETNNLAADTGFIGALKTHLVTADLFSGKAFNGGIFTGSTFRTQLSPAINGGIQIDTVGIRAWNADAASTFILNASTGALSVIGGTITGAVVRTAASGRRVQLSASGIAAWDASGNVTLSQNSSTGDIEMRGAVSSRSQNGNKLWLGANMSLSGAKAAPARPGIVFASDAEESISAALYRDGSYGALRLDSPYSNNTRHIGRSVLLAANSGIFAYAWRSGQTQGPGVNNTEMLYLGTDGVWSIGGGAPGKLLDGRIWGDTANSSINVVRNDNHRLVLESDRSTYLATSRLDITGPVYATAKNFRIPHPTREGYDLIHGSTESPMAGIEYWGEAQLDDDGFGVVFLPEYFEALAKEENRAILVTPKSEVDLLAVGDIIDGAFTVEGTPGQRFTWLVKAERRDADFEPVQPTRPEPDTAVESAPPSPEIEPEPEVPVVLPEETPPPLPEEEQPPFGLPVPDPEPEEAFLPEDVPVPFPDSAMEPDPVPEPVPDAPEEEPEPVPEPPVG